MVAGNVTRVIVDVVCAVESTVYPFTVRQKECTFMEQRHWDESLRTFTRRIAIFLTVISLS